MIRRMAVLVSILGIGAVPAAAQHPRPHPTPQQHTPQHPARQHSAQHDSVWKKMIGTWEGTITTPHGTMDGFKMVIAHEKDKWTASMTMPEGSPPQAGGPLSDVKMTEKGLTWTQTMMQMPCKGSASLIGENLRGETDCGHVQVGFLLKRK